VRQFYGPLYLAYRIDAMGKTLRWDVPGSRLLPTDRAAMLQSGSPPGAPFGTIQSLSPPTLLI